MALATVGAVVLAFAWKPAQPGTGGGQSFQEPMPPGPNPDSQYRLGPDSMPQEGVPKGEIRGPYQLPSKVYPGTQHTYWVYVPAQYDPAVPAALMVFQDGQAFKDENGDMRAQNVMDNLIYRREIPVMIGVFINPGRTPEQPEPSPQTGWGDGTTNRATEYNTPDDKYARVITEELMPVLYKEYNISKDPEQHGIGGSSSGRDRGFHGGLGASQRFPQGAEQRGQLRRSPGRICLSGARAGEREEADPRVSVRRPQRQPRHGRERRLRREARLVLPECAADEGAHAEGLRRELLVGHESARPEVRRRDHAGDDALAVARRAGFDRSERHGGAAFRQPAAGTNAGQVSH